MSLSIQREIQRLAGKQSPPNRGHGNTLDFLRRVLSYRKMHKREIKIMTQGVFIRIRGCKIFPKDNLGSRADSSAEIRAIQSPVFGIQTPLGQCGDTCCCRTVFDGVVPTIRYIVPYSIITTPCKMWQYILERTTACTHHSIHGKAVPGGPVLYFSLISRVFRRRTNEPMNEQTNKRSNGCRRFRNRSVIRKILSRCRRGWWAVVVGWKREEVQPVVGVLRMDF